MYAKTSTISEYDQELYEAMAQETVRQEDHIELIASENYASPRVLEAQGSVLTNKYAEGYPGKRYYGGCEYVDVVEQLAIDRAKALFGAAYANVQPHAGSQANATAYLALLNGGDTILGMSLADGGHLTHGASVNFPEKCITQCSMASMPMGIWITTKSPDLAEQHKPKLLLGGFSAYSRIVDWAKDALKSQTTWVPISSWIWRTLQALWRPASIHHPSRMRVVTTTTHKTLRGRARV